jgi:hypothetical protein
MTMIMKITNESLHFRYNYLFDKGLNSFGDCLVKSLENFVKMRNGGAVRVRGLRKEDKENIDKNELQNEKPYHYWVERGGKVFEEYTGRLLIVDIDEYYRTYGITEITKSSIGLMDEEIDCIDKERFITSNIDIQNIIIFHLMDKMFSIIYPKLEKAFEKAIEEDFDKIFESL